MNIHEYQAKRLLKDYGVTVLKGGIAYTPDEAVSVAEEIGGSLWVVKAQIHAGGRGKGGGVKLAKTLDEVRQVTSEMIGMMLVTHQTGAKGKEVQRVYIEQGCDIDRELYLAMMVDVASGQVTILASTEGGVDIEEVASNTPEKIIKLPIDPSTGILPFHNRKIAFALGLTNKNLTKSLMQFISGMYKAFTDFDISLLEVNPLVVTKDLELVMLDAKVGFDSNGLYRQKKVLELRDFSEEDPLEVEAANHELNYIKLDGTIGCLVNGAGLAMATMDIIQLNGGSPANFLDIGGGATRERVTEAFKLILSDANVTAILVNIFGGIMRCDIVAEGVIAAARELSLHMPLVVRLEGTNVELGKKILNDSGLNIISADDLGSAAIKVVKAAKEAV